MQSKEKQKKNTWWSRRSPAFKFLVRVAIPLTFFTYVFETIPVARHLPLNIFSICTIVLDFLSMITVVSSILGLLASGSSPKTANTGSFPSFGSSGGSSNDSDAHFNDYRIQNAYDSGKISESNARYYDGLSEERLQQEAHKNGDDIYL